MLPARSGPMPLTRSRFLPALLLAAIAVAIATLTRAALVVHTASAELTLYDLLGAFAIGFGYDLVTAAYFGIPLVLYLALMPERALRGRIHRAVLQAGFFAAIYLLLFVAAAEWIFWDEFESRFNFIAVDYLIYTNEVLGNIWESYPVPALLGAIGVAALAVFLPLRNLLRITPAAMPPASRLRHAVLMLGIPALATLGLDASMAGFSSNRYANELAGNGIYDFFAAFRNNEIDYTQYYVMQDEDKVFRRLRTLIAEPGARFVSDDPRDLRRRIDPPGAERRLNVVLITVESLSAEFLGRFGNTKGITPHLDALADKSLFFSNLYATGTRTDRGLEAITLSVPPTAGRSLVKRPHNENLFSLGQVFREHGYRTAFLYGGYGYFDNMNYFFGHNGFDVIDRTAIAADAVHFENAWGVADEDLYTQALKEIDATQAAGKPFFGLVMTTSNHRPYTYPDGRIDIPSPGKREGAVKYTDYAIHDFLERARRKPWFDDTVFVIVADHCAKSAGKEALTAARYRIPMFIYAPKHIPAGKVDRLISQIDIAPTLLGLLNFDYESRFYGRDALRKRQTDSGRALIGTYQKLGYIKDGWLTVLSPQQEVTSYRLGADGRQDIAPDTDVASLDAAVAYYEGASLLFARHR